MPSLTKDAELNPPLPLLVSPSAISKLNCKAFLLSLLLHFDCVTTSMIAVRCFIGLHFCRKDHLESGMDLLVSVISLDIKLDCVSLNPLTLLQLLFCRKRCLDL